MNKGVLAAIVAVVAVAGAGAYFGLRHSPTDRLVGTWKWTGSPDTKFTFNKSGTLLLEDGKGSYPATFTATEDKITFTSADGRSKSLSYKCDGPNRLQTVDWDNKPGEMLRVN